MVIPFDSKASEEAVHIYQQLRSRGQAIDLPDIFIGATAKAHHLQLATLNEKDFKLISDLNLILR